MTQLTLLFKLLSDETRLRILMLLYKEELCVCHIVGILDLPQPRISRGLSKFRDLGIVIDERREKFIYYRLANDNSLLLQILSFIDEQREYKDILKVDRDRLNNKESYVSGCQFK